MEIVDPYKALDAFVVECGTQREAAKRLGVTPQHISDLLGQRRTVSVRILKRLGLKRAVISAK